jgi:hypothetical protein
MANSDTATAPRKLFIGRHNGHYSIQEYVNGKPVLVQSGFINYPNAYKALQKMKQ